MSLLKIKDQVCSLQLGPDGPTAGAVFFVYARDVTETRSTQCILFTLPDGALPPSCATGS